MAKKAEGGKGGGARKYGQNRRQPAKQRYTDARRDENKGRRIAKMMRRFPAYKVPKGWIMNSFGKVVRDLKGR